MPGTPAGRIRQLDLLLGRIARERGLITPEQLKDALAEQARDTAVGRKARPLGVILVARGILTDHRLTALLEEQKAQALDLEKARREDILLGRLLIHQGRITAEQLNECLRLQAEALEGGGGRLPRLGELLVEKGHATPQAVNESLAIQLKTILACGSCGRRYNVRNHDPAKTYRCRACQGLLEPPASHDTVRVDGSVVFAPPPFPPAPAARAMRPAPAAPHAAPFGKYTVLRELGRGGMGVVYEALDTQLSRKVALKMMLTSPHADPKEAAQDEERFLREARLSASLDKNPHIVSVYEAGVIEGKRYLAMEFIQGKPMSDWRKMGSVSLRQQVALLRDVARAVHHAHEHGIIHRDLKPTNVLVDARHIPHVTDFGLAKMVGQSAGVSLTAAGMVVGTPAYMSPEQAQGFRTIDRRADVWSLGVMLYEILTGRPPFTGETAVEILMKAVKNEVPAPSTTAGGHAALDPAIENICLKALAKSPKDRYTTAEAFAADLTKWIQGEEVRVSLPKRRRAYEAKRSHAWLYAAAAAVLLGAGALMLWPSAPSVERDLARAERLMKEKKYRDALGTYEGALAKDPASARGLAGKREAQRRLDEQIEEEKQAAAQAAGDAARREAEEKARAEREAVEARARQAEDRLRREAEAAREAAEKARREAEEKIKTEANATLQSERERLAAERQAAEERAQAAEETARKAQEQFTAERRAAEERARAAEEAARQAREQAAQPVATAGASPEFLAFMGNRGFERGGLEGWDNRSVDGGIAAVVEIRSAERRARPWEIDMEGRYGLLLRSNDGSARTTSIGAAATPPFVPETGDVRFQCASENPGGVSVEVRILNPDGRELRRIPVESANAVGEKAGLRTIDVDDYRRRKAPIRLEFRQHTNEAGSGWVTMIDDLQLRASPPRAEGRRAEKGIASSSGVDLLKLIDVRRDAIRGVWSFSGPALVVSPSPDSRRAFLAIPYAPPDEYDVTMTAEQKGPKGGLFMVLVGGGRQFGAFLDGWGAQNRTSGIEEVDGKDLEDNETLSREQTFVKDKPAAVVWSVRRDGVAVTVDGRTVIRWKGEYRRVSVADKLEVRDAQSLHVGTFDGPFLISRMALVPVSGTGGRVLR